MPAHESQCDYVSVQCERCQDLVMRKDRPIHDCVKSMLAQYNAASDKLNEMSKKVEEITSDINKQTTILDRLN